MGPLEKSLVLWLLFEGLHLGLTSVWVAAGAGRKGDGEEADHRFLCRVVQSGSPLRACALSEVLHLGALWAFISTKHSKLFRALNEREVSVVKATSFWFIHGMEAGVYKKEPEIMVELELPTSSQFRKSVQLKERKVVRVYTIKHSWCLIFSSIGFIGRNRLAKRIF